MELIQRLLDQGYDVELRHNEHGYHLIVTFSRAVLYYSDGMRQGGGRTVVSAPIFEQMLRNAQFELSGLLTRELADG